MSKHLNLSAGFADFDQFLNESILRLKAYWIRALFARLRTLITTNHNMPLGVPVRPKPSVRRSYQSVSLRRDRYLNERRASPRLNDEKNADLSNDYESQ